MASIPPQNFAIPSNSRIHSLMNSPTYSGAHINPEPQAPPATSLPLDFDDPEVSDGKFESEKTMDALNELGFGSPME